MSAADTTLSKRRNVLSWRARIALGLFLALAIGVIWFTNQFLTDRYTETTKNRAEVRQALYAGNLISELQRTSVVPLLLSRDPALIGALNSSDFSQTSQHLITLKDDIDLASIMLLDAAGRTVAATDRALLGTLHRTQRYFIDTLRSNETVFNTFKNESGGIVFNYTRRVEGQGDLIGITVSPYYTANTFSRSTC